MEGQSKSVDTISVKKLDKNKKIRSDSLARRWIACLGSWTQIFAWWWSRQCCILDNDVLHQLWRWVLSWEKQSEHAKGQDVADNTVQDPAVILYWLNDVESMDWKEKFVLFFYLQCHRCFEKSFSSSKRFMTSKLKYCLLGLLYMRNIQCPLLNVRLFEERVNEWWTGIMDFELKFKFKQNLERGFQGIILFNRWQPSLGLKILRFKSENYTLSCSPACICFKE
jgi:hypothetical protein